MPRIRGYNSIMKTLHSYSWLTESFLKFFGSMRPERRKELLKKMNEIAASESADKQSRFWNSFGAWQGKETADEIIARI